MNVFCYIHALPYSLTCWSHCAQTLQVRVAGSGKPIKIQLNENKPPKWVWVHDFSEMIGRIKSGSFSKNLVYVCVFVSRVSL